MYRLTKYSSTRFHSEWLKVQAGKATALVLKDFEKI